MTSQTREAWWSRQNAWLAAAFGLATLVMTWPFTNYRALGEAAYGGDGLLIVWTLAWDNHALIEGLPLFRSNIYFPAPETLQYNEHLFGLSLFTLPWVLLGRSPVFAHNMTWWLAYVANGLAAFVLLRRFVANPGAAFVGSLVFTFSFYVQLHAAGHLHLIWLWGIPLSLWLLEHWFDRPSLGRIVGWALVVTIEALTSWYLAVIIGMANGLFGLLLVCTEPGSGVAPGTPAPARRWALRAVHAIIGAGLVAGLVYPFARYYLGIQAAPGAAASLSATIGSFVIPPANTIVGRWWLAHLDERPGSIWGESTVFLGWTTLALAGVGLVVLWRGRATLSRAWLFVLLAVVGMLLSLGPSPALPGGDAWAPFRWVAQLPGFSGMRAPARFVVLVTVGLAGLVAIALDAFLSRPSRWRLLVAAAVVPLMLAEWFVVDFPAGAPQVIPVPAIYRSPQVPSARSLVSLPDYSKHPDWYLGGDYLYFATAHWRPIVNGFGRSEPPGHADLIEIVGRFPATAATLRDLGIHYVVLHADRFPDRGAAVLSATANNSVCRLAARGGSDYLFELVP